MEEKVNSGGKGGGGVFIFYFINFRWFKKINKPNPRT